MISTHPKTFFKPPTLKCLIPSCVPTMTPKSTAQENNNTVAGNSWIDAILPIKPDNELKKIKAEAVPDASLMEVHPKKTIKGDRKIPPPVPVNPDNNPITAPSMSATNQLISTLLGLS